MGGLHYQGDVNDLLDLTVWKAAFLFPPCYQQLRLDLDCIEAKIADMRHKVFRCIKCHGLGLDLRLSDAQTVP